MSLRAAFDTNGGDWAALFAQSTDQANQLRFTTAGLEAAANISNYERVASTGSVGDGLYPRYNSDRAKYGKGYVTWAPSATVGQQMYIGTNLGGGTHNSHSVAAGNVISGGMWVLRGSGSAADTWRLRLYNIVAGTVIASSAAVALSSSAFTRFTVTGTAAGATSQYALILERVSGSDTTTLLLTGAMLVNGPTVPDWYNSGPTSLLGVLTDYWGGGKWGLGFVKPYQYVAAVGKADLKLSNADKRFSPEYASGPLYGMLLPNLLLQIGDPDYGIWWTGWTDSWAPEPGTNRDKKANLHATDTRRFLDKTKVFVPLVSGAGNTVPVSLIVNVMDEIDLPIVGSMAGTEIAGDYEDISTNGSSEHPPYYFDSNEEGDDALRLLGDILTAVQGKFLFNREGIYIPFSSCAIDASTASVNIDYDWIDADYVYGERIINTCDVTTVLKKISSGTVTLWELDENVVLAAGESESFRVNYRNLSNGTNGDRMIVGGANVTATGWTLSSGTVPTDVTVTLSEQAAQSCLVTLANVSGSSRTVTAGTITGNKIIALRTITKRYEDATSITDHGVHAEMIKSHWIANRTWAKRLGKWLVTRFKDPRGEMRWVEVDGNENTSLLFSAGVTTSVRVKDDQVSHEDVYGVIGELHTVSEGLTNHVGKLYLEPMYDQEIKEVSLP